MDDKNLQKVAQLVTSLSNQFNERVSGMEKHMKNLANKTYDRMEAVYKEVVSTAPAHRIRK